MSGKVDCLEHGFTSWGSVCYYRSTLKEMNNQVGGEKRRKGGRRGGVSEDSPRSAAVCTRVGVR